MLKRTMVASLVSGLFVAGGAIAAPFDSWTELDPKVRAVEQALYRVKSNVSSERSVEGVEVERKFEVLQGYSPL